MKYWTGYITAAVIGAITWALMELAKTYSALVDTVYPYMSRMIMGFLGDWSAGVSFCLWQMVVILLAVLVIGTIVLMFTLKWNPVRWLGWLAAICSFVYFLNTVIFGLNYYAGPIADDLRLEVKEYSVSQLADAAVYYRDKANELATKVPRDEKGEVAFDDFETLAVKAADGFDTLVNEKHHAVFAGSTAPVKELGWSGMYTSMGITGFTLGITGEAAVNPNIPALCQPFTMCHEMAHRMSIANEGDANFAAFLACDANSDIQFRYAAYFMAYRYCYNTLVSVGTSESSAAATEVSAKASPELKNDMSSYSAYFSSRRSDKATKVATTVNDTYLKTSGDSAGVASYDEVTDLLYSWYYHNEILPTMVEEEKPFDPFDETQVDLSYNSILAEEENQTDD